MKVPTYQKYGITKKEFENTKSKNSRISFLLTHEIPLVLGIIVGVVFWFISYRKLNPSGFFETAWQIFIFGTMGMMCIGIPMLIFKGLEKLYYMYLRSRSQQYNSILKYESDREKFDFWKIRRDESYWKLLDGSSFENEVLSVFSKLGYEFESEHTEIPSFQEDGISKRKFILHNNDEKYLLICRTSRNGNDFHEYAKIINENNIGADKIIIVSPYDFPNEFVNQTSQKPVKLMPLKELVELVKTIKE